MGVRRVVVVVMMLGVLVGVSTVIMLAARGSGVSIAAEGTAAADVLPRPSTSEAVMPSAASTQTPAPAPTPTITPVTDLASDTDYAPPDHIPSGDGHVSVTSRVMTKDKVFFITIDDGMERDPAALRLVQERKIPVTAFLTQWTAPGFEDYFQAITRYGSIQNHSMTHRSFATPDTNLRWEICETQRRYAKAFGYRPWLLRPPYGEGDERREVIDTAASCGIESIVLWDVVVSDGGAHIEWWTEGLRPGDIVLFHFAGDLGSSLATIMEMADEAGLRPASLADYL